MLTFRNALLLPTTERSPWTIPTGLYTETGEEITESQCWHLPGRAATLAPALTDLDAKKTVRGRTLFLGAYSSHFGHRLVESSARFHGFDAGVFDQVVFFTQPGRKPWFMRATLNELMAIFDIPAPKIIFPSELTRFEEITVPSQGWGAGALAHGTPEFRDFARKTCAGGQIAPKGAARLYISRTANPDKRGSLLAEEELEAHFRAAGFEIYHPQNHSLQDQVAQYKAADVIAGPDGTPFHLVALAARAEARIYVIQRRISDDAGHLVQQLVNFGIGHSRLLPCKPLGWAFAGARHAFRSLWGEADFPALRAAMVADGVLPADTPDWPALSDAGRNLALQALMEAEGNSLCEVTSDQTKLRHVPSLGEDGRPRLVTLEAVSALAAMRGRGVISGGP